MHRHLDPEKHFHIKLQKHLVESGIWHRFLEKPNSTIHTADASQVTGIPLKRISKSLIATTGDGKYYSLIVPGDKKVDLKKAAQIIGVKNIQLVPFNNAHEISGYPPGGTPAIGYQKQIKVIIDEELAMQETFFCGGGSTQMLLELKSQDVIKKNKATIGNIQKIEEQSK